MDQQQSPQGRSRSPSAVSQHGQSHQPQQPHIRNSHSPSPARPFNPNESAPSIGLGLGIEASNPSSQQFPAAQPDFSDYNAGSNNFLGNQQAGSFSEPDFAQQLQEDDSSFSGQAQGSYSQNLLGANFGDTDFSLFPPTSGEQFNTPLFVNDNQAANPDLANMASSQTHHSPTPPHLLNPEPRQASPANHSPSFSQHQFSSSPGRHSRNASLGPADALLPGQLDWGQAPQFQGHRRSPSEYSDVSSVAHSPNLVSADTFDIDQNHSPMQRPQDAALYQELHGIGSFSISDHGPSQQHSGRSPSHSPAISPRIPPQSLPDMNQQTGFMLGPQNNGFGGQAYGLRVPEAFPQLQQGSGPEMQGQVPQMAPPSINIDFAPTATKSGFEQLKAPLDIDSLTPPERGRARSRPRAVTDPFNSGGAVIGRTSASSSLSPSAGSDARSDSRSLSPLDRSGPGGTSPNRRRQSTSAVPNNVIALRLADPDYNGPGSQTGDTAGGAGGPKRVQKHPATFQCHLCPKRFTRAYNLRSHLRTHTDERPFVCTVCGKAFARQHDRKRHEGLHSGEKKFVCKGELKAGGQWGCGRRFARADALGRHFRSEAGRICIKPLLDEEMIERQRVWNEQRMAAAAHQQHQQQQNMGMGGMMPQQPPMMTLDPAMGPGYPVDASGNYALPAALLAQYPALAQMNWNAADMGGGSGMEDEMSGRSSFDASDYDEADEGGYVSGPGTGFGPGGMGDGFGEMGYASDYGGR